MRKPNIVLILVDDMGYGDFSLFNNGLSSTHRLDSLIKESVCLTQAYTASPVCNPSRAALMTGRYPHRTGSIDTLEYRGLERLSLRERTLADVLKQSGYATGLVGKWHLGSYDPRYHPNQRGFDEAICFRGGMHDYFNWRLEYNQQVVRADGRYLTDLWADEAVEFIQRHSKEPFFLHVTFNAPHTPLEAPYEEIQPFMESGKFNTGVSILYGMLHRLDRAVERILECLDKNGLTEDTLVVFSSDNGPQFGGEGDHDLTRFNCHFNGAKGNVYEGGIRVPMLVRYPQGGLGGGVEISEMIHFTDWYPTILSLVGVRASSHLPLDGIDVSDVLHGKSDSIEPTRFWQWNRYTPLVTCNAAVRDGDWKLVRPWQPGAGDVPDVHWLWVSMYGPEYFIENGYINEPDPKLEVGEPLKPELYNIATDPLEQKNLAALHPQRVSNMLVQLENWFEEVEKERSAIKE